MQEEHNKIVEHIVEREMAQLKRIWLCTRYLLQAVVFAIFHLAVVYVLLGYKN